MVDPFAFKTKLALSVVVAVIVSDCPEFNRVVFSVGEVSVSWNAPISKKKKEQLFSLNYCVTFSFLNTAPICVALAASVAFKPK